MDGNGEGKHEGHKKWNEERSDMECGMREGYKHKFHDGDDDR